MEFRQPPKDSPRSARHGVVLVTAAVFLVAAGIFAAWHRADLVVHATDGLCKVCLTISGLTDSNVGQASLSLLPAASPPCDLAYAVRCVFRPAVPPKARGPPVAS